MEIKNAKKASRHDLNYALIRPRATYMREQKRMSELTEQQLNYIWDSNQIVSLVLVVTWMVVICIGLIVYNQDVIRRQKFEFRLKPKITRIAMEETIDKT